MAIGDEVDGPLVYHIDLAELPSNSARFPILAQMRTQAARLVKRMDHAGSARKLLAWARNKLACKKKSVARLILLALRHQSALDLSVYAIRKDLEFLRLVFVFSDKSQFLVSFDYGSLVENLVSLCVRHDERSSLRDFLKLDGPDVCHHRPQSPCYFLHRLADKSLIGNFNSLSF